MGTGEALADMATLQPGWSAGPGPAGRDYEAIPVEERTIAGIWNRRLASGGDLAVFSFDGAPYITAVEVQERIERWQSVLHAIGLGAGDRVALMLPNQFDTLACFLAATLSSMVVVPINPDFRGDMLRHVLGDSGVRALVTDTATLPQVSPDWQLSELQTIVLLDSDATQVEQVGAARVVASSAYANCPRITVTEPRPTDLAAVMYTSGTTGASKGALLPHEYFVFYAWSYAFAMGHRPSDVLFTPLPMFHVNALVVTIFPALIVGARIVIIRRFSASRFWDQIADSGATHFAGMGTIGNILMRRPALEYRSDHKLRHCHIVPAPDRLVEFERRFGVPVYYATYGQTEGQIIFISRDDSYRPGLLGKLHPYHEVAVVDDDGREVPDGTPGELVARPKLPNIMFRGYLGRPEATLEAFRDLWYHTGDLAMRDSDHDFWFLGRIKDAIRRRGENISAAEVEQIAMQHSAAGEAAAVGVASDVGEEEVLLVVTPRVGEHLDPADLHAFCVERMPKYMVPRYIDVRNELPKNASHKVLKNELRETGVRRGTFDAEPPSA
jgi:crotonobetaine/carnitine-CoA ligase